jgi:hypothetical protein
MARRFGVFCVSFGWALLFAQAPETKKTTISGTVVNSATGQPIPGALVIATLAPAIPSRPAQREPVSQRTVTDASGRFSFEADGAMEASLQISRQGYRSENDQDVAFIVLQREHLADTTVRLLPQSVITGRVVNSDGDPLSGLTVEAVRIEIADGRRQVKQGYANKPTDDRGDYRLWNLPPGSYYVKVAGRLSRSSVTNETTHFDLAQEAYGPMYYPSSQSQEEAQVLRIEAGQTVSAPFTLEGRKAHEIRGTTVNAPAQRRLQIRLLRGGDILGGRGAVNVAAGTFQAVDVAPGSYTLQIYTVDGGPMWFGEIPVTIGESDLTGVSMAMSPGVDVQGKFENTGIDRSSFQVSAHRLDAPGIPGGAADVTATQDQGGETFVFKGLLPGRYELSFSGGAGSYVSSVRAGSTDAMSEGMMVAAGSAPELTVTVTPGGGAITGTVEGAPEQPDFTGDHWDVLLAGGIGAIQKYQTRPVYGGKFQFTSLAPGDYTLYAWPASHPLEFRTPAVLSSLSQFGVSVKASPQGNQEVTVKPIPKEALP